MNALYSLRLQSLHVIGVVPLPSRTLIAAKALGLAWKAALAGSAQPFTIHVVNERGESLWQI